MMSSDRLSNSSIDLRRQSVDQTLGGFEAVCRSETRSAIVLINGDNTNGSVVTNDPDVDSAGVPVVIIPNGYVDSRFDGHRVFGLPYRRTSDIDRADRKEGPQPHRESAQSRRALDTAVVVHQSPIPV